MSATIDLERERLSLNAVARLCDVNVSTVWRWTLKGLQRPTADGRGRVCVVLPSFPLGGRRYVYRDELERFLSAESAEVMRPPAESAQRISRRAADAERELDRIGIGCGS